MKTFNLVSRNDRIGSLMYSILYQLLYCHKNKYCLTYNINSINYNDSPFVKCIIRIFDEFNRELMDYYMDKIIIDGKNEYNTSNDKINIYGHGGTDLCYGGGAVVQELRSDFVSYFKEYFNEMVKAFFTADYKIPFDVENSIVIHLRLDDMHTQSDYDGKVCSGHFINLIDNSENCFFTNGPDDIYNKQNPLSAEKIKKQLDILLEEFPKSKVVIIASPLTQIPEMNFNYDQVIQTDDFNYDLFLLSKSKKIILSRSNFALLSLFFGEHTHVHMPLWGHFACAGFGTKYDKSNYTYFY